MRTSRTFLALATASLLLVPGALAQTTIQNPDESTPTTLYFHVFDTFNKFVINTQAMDSSFFEVGGANFVTLRDTPVNDLWPVVSNQDPGAQRVNWDFNTVYGISTAGPVEYEFIENGKPRFHPEPGIAQEIEIDESVTPMVTLYGTVRDILGSRDSTNALLDYTVRVTVREGDDAGRETETLDAGDLIMRGEQTFHIVDNNACVPSFTFFGQTTPGACAPASANTIVDGQTFAADGHPFVIPDEDGIVEFQIPLTIDQDFIPKKEAFNVRIDWYQLTGTGQVEDDQFAEGYMRLYADPTHLPRLDFNIYNPVYISFVHPQVAAGTLLIHTGVNSPWGTYDVDAENVQIRIEGPSEPENLERVVAQNKHVHGLHDQDAEITYLWKFRDEKADLGEYTIHLEVSNNGILDDSGNIVDGSQKTATAQAGFVIKKTEAFGIDDTGTVVPETVGEGGKGTPSIGPVATLGLLAIAFIARRRIE